MVPIIAVLSSHSAFFTFSSLSIIQRTLGPEKYVERPRPVISGKLMLCFLQASSKSGSTEEVRVSDQTIALYNGTPDSLSQTTVVSRWQVIPTAPTSWIGIPREDIFCATSDRHSWTLLNISSGSCSSQPGLGTIYSCVFYASQTICPFLSNKITRELVVP